LVPSAHVSGLCDDFDAALLTSAEQEEVIRRLTARCRSIRDIATQLATTKRTVSRRRASPGAHDDMDLNQG
jgi:DNA-binding NarL/FixJ family response regulator